MVIVQLLQKNQNVTQNVMLTGYPNGIKSFQ